MPTCLRSKDKTALQPSAPARTHSNNSQQQLVFCSCQHVSAACRVSSRRNPDVIPTQLGGPIASAVDVVCVSSRRALGRRAENILAAIRSTTISILLPQSWMSFLAFAAWATRESAERSAGMYPLIWLATPPPQMCSQTLRTMLTSRTMRCPSLRACAPTRGATRSTRSAKN